MVIRIHGSFLQLLSYYKNVSLLSCFVGLGIGLSIRKMPGGRALLTFFPFLCLQIALLYVLRYSMFQYYVRNPSSEMTVMGMKSADTLGHLLLAQALLTTIFVANAVAFIPMGQIVAWCSREIEPIRAYGLNLLGSVGGVVVFTAACSLMTPPAIWIGIAVIFLVPLFGRSSAWLGSIALSGLVTALYVGAPLIFNELNLYSSYSQLTIRMNRNHPIIMVNNFYFQRMLDLSKPVHPTADLHYSLPYRLAPDPTQVLVLGAGTGNDVAAALRFTKAKVDAVEIDPIIYDLGRKLHPLDPYFSDRVRVILDDGRAFMRRTDTKYDLIVFGLLDSHSTVSGALRLDSYIYTLQSFKDARKLLSPTGVLCMSFSVGETSILTSRIYKMMETAFNGRAPYLHSTGYDAGILFCNADNRELLSRGAAVGAPSTSPSYLDPSVEVATDDWPFLYLKSRSFPVAYLLLFLLLGAATWLLARRFMEVGQRRSFPLRPFLLGAGFMLLETKSISELALVYGATWIVTPVTIVSVLLMAYLANLVAGKTRPLPELLIYSLLLATIGCSLAYSYGLFGVPSPTWSKVITPLVLTAPLFFSGLCFSHEVRRAPSVADSLYPNTLGAVVGGFLEYNCLRFGFHSLYWLAIALYAIAYIASPRRSPRTI
jgi:SAM-dependent methyltransferase